MSLSPSNKQRMLEWIDAASYEELLTRWRHTPDGSVWFQYEVGEHFSKVMAEKKDATPPDEQVAISKRVGW